MGTPATVSSGPDGARPRSRRAALWFGLLGGGVAWMLHLLLAYVIAEFGCLAGLGATRLGGLSLVTWLLLGASVFSLALALAAVATCLGIRRSEHEAGASNAESQEAAGFTGRLGLINNVVFTGIIVVQSVPILFFLGDC